MSVFIIEWQRKFDLTIANRKKSFAFAQWNLSNQSNQTNRTRQQIKQTHTHRQGPSQNQSFAKPRENYQHSRHTHHTHNTRLNSQLQNLSTQK